MPGPITIDGSSSLPEIHDQAQAHPRDEYLVPVSSYLADSFETVDHDLWVTRGRRAGRYWLAASPGRG